jgi:hypothetical protein
MLEQQLINKQELVAQNIEEKKQKEKELIGHIQRSDKGASLPDFIAMLSDLISKVMREYEVSLDPDEGHISTDTFEKLGHPYICYSILSREPKNEIKRRMMEYIVDKDGRKGSQWMQQFICILQFNMIAGDYTTADAVMNSFEELMTRYAGYFKKNGIAEILFKKQLTDKNFESYRQSCSIRSLQYRVDIQKITVDFDSTIQDIQPVSGNT